MDTYQLLEHAKFSDAPTGNATALHKSKYGRVIVFALRDGQALSEHAAPAPVNVVVIQGRAIFTGREGVDVAVVAPALLTMSPGENHSVRADGEDLVFAVVMGNATPADEDTDPGLSDKPTAKLRNVSNEPTTDPIGE